MTLPLRTALVCLALFAFRSAGTSAQRPSTAHSDLQGFWTNGTITPLQRPADFTAKPVLTEAEAAEYERTWLEQFRKNFSPEDLQAPDLDYTYMDRMTMVAGRRTSLVVDPPDGKIGRAHV